MRRIRLCLAASVLAVLGLLGGAAQAASGGTVTREPPAAGAAGAAGCKVTYTVQSQWSTGFTTSVTITNTGPAITSWTLGYSYSGNQQLVNGWNGTWSQSGPNVTVANASWNGSLGTGASAQIGAQFSFSGGTNTSPTAFTLNGVACNQPSQPAPSVSLTSPTAGQIFTPGSAITLAATASSSGGSIASVAFFDSTGAASNNLIGTATSSPYSVTWANVAAGSYSLTAVATDNLGQTSTSSPVAITVAGASVVINPASLTVQQGSTGTFAVSLSSAPSASVTVTVSENSGGDPDLSASPTSLTFTSANWNTPQNVTITAGTNSADVGGNGVFTAAGSGYTSGSVTVTEAAKSSGYGQWFLSLYSDIKNPANGYFSPKGIPYHSVETLIVEAPDYGHETTSETYSYWLWLEADYGRVTGDWTNFNNAWTNMETYAIPNDANQPGQCVYNASSPAQYGPEQPSPSNYPVALNSSVPVGSDPLAAELKGTYGTCSIYQPVWIMDTSNRYGFGQQEDGTSTPSLINTFQRGAEESVWDTVPQPDWDTMKFGGPNGFLDLFNNGGGGSFAPQYKYTDAPDADARLVQAAFWANTYAKAQGKSSAITATLAKAAKLGDYLRYSMFDKYFKQISASCSQSGSIGCPAGTSKANEDTYLLSWFDAWGGSTTGAWSWRISGTSIHEGYQNPLAAYALSTDSSLIPQSPTAKADWTTSLTTQLNLFQWLQSAQGAIAGGVTDSWGGNYGDVAKPPAGDPTFDGMYYDWQPQYHNPPSNQWFGYQTWPMERVAEYYFVTGNAQAKAILDKWVSWAESVATVNTSTGAICLPGAMTWTGQPSASYTSGSTPPAANPGLTVSVSGCSSDLGVSASLAKVYSYYAAKSGNTTAQTAAQNIIDVIHKSYADSLGYSAPETRTDYKNFTVPYSTSGQEGVFIPSSWTGTYPGGVKLSSSTNTFLSLRPWYTSDPAWSKVQAYLNGGSAPVFNYHRFWAESDIATAFDTFAYLFPAVQPPAGF